MSERIENDESLAESAKSGVIQRPIIIVEALSGRRQQFILCLNELDPMVNEPTLFGILLSDLIDHIAAAYHDVGLGSQAELRAHIFKVMQDEDRFKQIDPSRGRQRGKTVLPSKN